MKYYTDIDEFLVENKSTKCRSYPLGKTFQEVFANFRIPSRIGDLIISMAKKEGYTETGVCYAAGKGEDKIRKFIGDNRFVSVFMNEVRKYALKPGDPRWNKK